MIPSAIKVCNFTIAVKKRPHPEMKRNGLAAQFSGPEQLITLDESMTEDNMKDALLHEALHALFYAHGLAALLDMDPETEEKIVVSMTPAILALLRNNPKLALYLTS